MPDIRRKSAAILLALVLVPAIATRLVGLSSAPPALMPDEAGNGYDAYCLLETGRDRWGAPFPLHLEAFGKGDFRPALYAYLTVPLVAVLGPQHFELATRLPAACWAVLTIVCFYGLVSRVCDRRTALWAALLLALSPWHIRISRFGHESALTPGFLIFALALLAKAGWPLCGRDDEEAPADRLRWPGMTALGVILALSFYSYASMCLFIPAMALAVACIYRGFLRRALAGRQSRRALLAGLIAFVPLIVPIAWLTFTQWSQVHGRAGYVSLFHQGLPLADVLKQAGAQYLAHYGPVWLFKSGDASPLSSTPHVGQLNWILLPLLAVGLYVMWRRRKDNRACALIVAWLLLHPLASAVCTDGPHSGRAACGIGVFQWIAAIGISALTTRWSDRPGRGWLVGGILLAAVLANGAWAFHQYVTWVRGPLMRHLHQTDLRDAVVFLRDRWLDYDRIFISDHTSNEHEWANLHPYIYVAIYLPVEPARFQTWEKTVGYRRPEHGFHYVESAGPFTFSTQPTVLAEQFRNHPGQRVLVVGRPGDVSGGRLLQTIKDPPGQVRFELIEVIPPG